PVQVAAGEVLGEPREHLDHHGGDLLAAHALKAREGVEEARTYEPLLRQGSQGLVRGGDALDPREVHLVAPLVLGVEEGGPGVDRLLGASGPGTPTVRTPGLALLVELLDLVAQARARRAQLLTDLLELGVELARPQRRLVALTLARLQSGALLAEGSAQGVDREAQRPGGAAPLGNRLLRLIRALGRLSRGLARSRRARAGRTGPALAVGVRLGPGRA